MTRAETSTGVPQNALVALKLRSEVAESLTGVLQNGHEPSGRIYEGIFKTPLGGFRFESGLRSLLGCLSGRL